MPASSEFVIYALMPGVAMVLAGLWAILRAPGEKWRSALMHFAAGVVFAVVAVEFLPDRYLFCRFFGDLVVGIAVIDQVESWNLSRSLVV